jgi:hypothetical protein
MLYLNIPRNDSHGVSRHPASPKYPDWIRIFPPQVIELLEQANNVDLPPPIG